MTDDLHISIKQCSYNSPALYAVQHLCGPYAIPHHLPATSSVFSALRGQSGVLHRCGALCARTVVKTIRHRTLQPQSGNYDKLNKVVKTSGGEHLARVSSSIKSLYIKQGRIFFFTQASGKEEVDELQLHITEVLLPSGVTEPTG